jgi:uncharacterized membrane protein
LQISNWKSVDLLIFGLALQIIASVTIVLNITIARQVIGFVYLTFIPGFIFLKLLKLNDLDLWETIILSAGVSIGFLMCIGLFVNALGPLVGVLKPLSLMPLMITVNSVVLLTLFLSCFRNKEASAFKPFIIPKLSKLSPSIYLFILLPILSVLGAICVNVFQNNVLLLTLIIAISVLFILGTASEKFVPRKIYPFAILMIAIALLFHSSLISNYVYGGDSTREYYLFRVTEENSHWDPSFSAYATEHDQRSYDMMNAMLSVTVLPTIYSHVLNMEGTWIFKIIYPLIFSLVPLVLYQIFRMHLSEKTAFMSTFLFMAYEAFFTELLGLTRQIIAELFFVLLFYILLKPKISKMNKSIFFAVFSIALIVSHYSISYLFIFLVFLTWIALSALNILRGRVSKTSITASLVALFFVMSFAWYIYTSKSGAFEQVLSMIDYVSRGILTEFFNPSSRSEGVLMGLGIAAPPSLGHLIGRIFAYLVQFFIVIGFLTLIRDRKKTVYDDEYHVFILLNMALLALLIVLPNFAASFNMTRFYHILLFFLAPLFILGSETLFNILWRFKTKAYPLILILIILIPFFLYQTEFIYEVTGDESWSIPLSKYRMGAIPYIHFGLIQEQDAFGSKWAAQNLNAERTTIYSDWPVSLFLLKNSGVSKIEVISNPTVKHANGTLYLRRVNVEYGIVRGIENYWNLTQFSSDLNNMNKIYSNGGSEIYQSPESNGS